MTMKELRIAKNVEYKDSQKYECHAGALMAGVALKGNLANVK